MWHDTRLRASARAIYDACYPTEELAPVGFEQAEKYGTIHYRRAVQAALDSRREWTGEQAIQLNLI
ncbi:hypothetical protein H7F50_13510 [Novosphingobium flavum]|uniref:hypothetical protein n=1 Tax=Novosphingobium aerophilum TaxID=2839843 RepID=UPI00163A84F3|nr:hypothetical protein [Novosphingobium aerophilum]MBC2662770.1 hypothetical protein [Novosphingobium aerophilum]